VRADVVVTSSMMLQLTSSFGIVIEDKFISSQNDICNRHFWYKMVTNLPLFWSQFFSHFGHRLSFIEPHGLIWSVLFRHKSANGNYQYNLQIILKWQQTCIN
jgi:hypothetical protein